MDTTYSKSTKYDQGMPSLAHFQQHAISVPTGASTTVYFEAGELGMVPFDITSTWTEADRVKQQTADLERAQAVEAAKATLESNLEAAAPPKGSSKITATDPDTYAGRATIAYETAGALADALGLLDTAGELSEFLRNNPGVTGTLRGLLAK